MAGIDKLHALADTLRSVAWADERKLHDARKLAVLQALALALRNGFAAGIRLDPSEPEWPVAYIELPTGQVSWRLPQHPTAWDGHDTPTKDARCRAFCAQYPEG